jgi:predicted short-subunit dehydrogenase-like oxidoreductase (DUF2520 family)
MLPAMAGKPQIAIVGPGRLGRALAVELARAGYRVGEIIPGSSARSQRSARVLAQAVRARVVSIPSTELAWFCVPDREITRAAHALASQTAWKEKIAFHSSGALASDELDVLRRRGARVAAVHPLMTFVRGAIPSLRGVPFGVEGDAAAVRMARGIVRRLGGELFSIPRNRKAAYHAWGAFTSPLLVALLATAEQVARAAGFAQTEARRNMLPIVRQTLANYAKLGPAGAFSGPIVRGDAAIVRKHLQVLRSVPGAKEVYIALAQAAMRHLPVGERKGLEKALR